jgi:23S rRNA (adenine1618-N6)-methyltransferase
MKSTNTEKQTLNTPEKNNLHPRNLHRYRYDFDDLTKTLPELKPFVFINKFNVESIDFADPKAVRLLNKSILMHFYSIKNWDIPEGYLCPPVPGRADYIHYLADLLAISNNGKIPTGSKISILDIGVGANCIYPIIGSKEYGWQFVGTEIDPVALKSAEEIVKSNDILKGKIDFRLQKNIDYILEGILLPSDRFDAIICNPPFHASAEEAMEGNRRKQNNLADKAGKMSFEIPETKALTKKKLDSKGFQQTHSNNSRNHGLSELNFGGHDSELWCEGGEKEFIKKIVRESKNFKSQVLWFTSLVSNNSHLQTIENALKNAKVARIKIIEMAQGQKISRFIAWTYLSKTQHDEWAKANWK